MTNENNRSKECSRNGGSHFYCYLASLICTLEVLIAPLLQAPLCTSGLMLCRLLLGLCWQSGSNNCVHVPLERLGCILKAEEYEEEFSHTERGDDSCLGDILFV